MPVSTKPFGRRAWLALPILALLIFTFTANTFAQETPAPKSEVFFGYMFYDPAARTPLGGREIGPGFRVNATPRGWGASTAYFFHRNVGIMGDFSASFGKNYRIGTIMIGPVVRFPGEHTSFFLEAGAGLHQMSLSGANVDRAIGIFGGGGMDLKLSPLFSWRVVKADWVYASHNWFPYFSVTSPMAGPRIGTGIVMTVGGGGTPPPPATAACSAAPTEVFVGEPVRLTATGQNFDPKRTITYVWNVSGGKVQGSGATVNIDTAGMAPGSYTATASLSDGKMKVPVQCAPANFTVKEIPKNPPTISCTANPSTIQTGQQSTITCNVASPDGRPTTVAWQSSGGQVSGSGNSAILNAAEPGSVTVTATATDDRGLSSPPAQAMVMVMAPPPPPPPPEPPAGSAAAILKELSQHGMILLPVQFDVNKSTIKPESEPLLDEVASALKQEPTMRVRVEGHTDNTGSRALNVRLSNARAVSVKAALIKRGIDANRMVPKGFAFDKPIADNTTAEGRAKNRRVQLVVLKPGEEVMPMNQAAPPAARAKRTGTAVAAPAGTRRKAATGTAKPKK